MYMLLGWSLWDIWMQLSRMGYCHAGYLIFRLLVLSELFCRVVRFKLQICCAFLFAGL
jgi:hypothetical protein